MPRKASGQKDPNEGAVIEPEETSTEAPVAEEAPKPKKPRRAPAKKKKPDPEAEENPQEEGEKGEEASEKEKDAGKGKKSPKEIDPLKKTPIRAKKPQSKSTKKDPSQTVEVIYENTV